MIEKGDEVTKNLLDMLNEIVNVRKYQEQGITEDTLMSLYKSFLMGPSSISTQARELLVLESESQRQVVIDSTLDPYMTAGSYGAQSWIAEAPFVGVVLVETRRATARVGARGVEIALQEAEAAIQNFRILAQSKRLSTACIREFDPEMLRERLQLPWYINISAIITAGYSDTEADIPPRLLINEAIHQDKWS